MKRLALCLMTGTLLLTACATTTSTNNNPQGYYGSSTLYRTITERISDEAIERAGHKNLPSIHGINENSVRIAINSFRREVLLTGEVPSEQIKAEVVSMIGTLNDVKKIHDNLIVTPTPKAQSHTLHENYLKSKILAKIISLGGVKSSQYKIVVRNNMAYVIAFVTAEQEKTIMQGIGSVQGIDGVRMFGAQITGDTSLLTGNNQAGIDNGEDTDGLVYGGQVATPAPFAITDTPTTAPLIPMQTTAPTKKPAPIVRMDGNIQSPYVQLYNNTSKP